MALTERQIERRFGVIEIEQAKLRAEVDMLKTTRLAAQAGVVPSRTIDVEYRCGHIVRQGTELAEGSPKLKEELEKARLRLCPTCETRKAQKDRREEGVRKLESGEA